MKKLLLGLTFLLFGVLFAEWTIVATYPIPENASGLAWDGEYLYCGMYGANGDEVYRIDPSDGTSTLLFTGSMDDTYGMTWDGDHLWITDHPGSSSNPAIAYQLDMSGNILQQFNLPDHYMSGIAWDNGDYWVSTYYDPDGYIYKLDDTGAILDEFSAPDNQPWDLCMENGSLWMADYWGDALYKIDPSDGSLIESHASEGVDPAGIVFDGTYLWYCDNGQGGNDYLYKVDLGGVGTPAIQLGWDEHDFGNIVIDESVEISLPITNTGNADLLITDFNSTQASFDHTENLPITITPGNTYNFNIICYPQVAGVIEGTCEVVSNDPVNPSESISLAVFGIYADQEIEYEPTMLDFGIVRLGAITGRTIQLANLGAQDLSVTGISIDNTLFYENEADFPITLATRDTVLVRIWLNAHQPGDNGADITIYCNDADEATVTIPVIAAIGEMTQDVGSEYWYFQTNLWGEKVTAIKKFTDINGDGIDEVVVCDNKYHVYCLNGNSSGEADIFWRFDTDIDEIGYGSVYDHRGLDITDDLNNDGVIDVVIGTAWGSRSIFALDGTNGDLLWYYDTHQIGDGGWVYQVDGRRDFTGDGVSDILASSGDDGNGTGPRAIFLLNGTDGSVEWMEQFEYARSSVSSIDDQNGDNIPDVICGGSSDYSDADFSLLSGADGSVIFLHNIGSNTCWAVIDISDVTGDGVQDMVYGTFSGQLVCLDNEDNVQWTYTEVDLLTHIERAFYNNVDYVIPTYVGGDICVAVNTATGVATTWYSGAGTFIDCTPIGDLDGDNQFDILGGKLTGQALVISGSESSEFWSTLMTQPIDRTRAVDDIDDNGSPEMVFGMRNGYMVCLSGGTDAGEPFANITINVTTNSGDSPEGAQYEFAGDQIYSGEVPLDGVVTLTDVPYGIYNLTVTLPLFDDYIVENFDITSDLEINVNLLETLTPVQNAYAEVDGSMVCLYWDEMNDTRNTARKECIVDRSFLGVNIYQNDVLIEEEFVDSSPFCVEDVEPGTHTFALTNVYSSGESEPVELEVIVLATGDPGMESYVTALKGNTPNPFNPETTVSYSVKEYSHVMLTVLNIRGQIVKTLVDDDYPAGEHRAVWRGMDSQDRKVASGVYFLSMTVDGRYVCVKKMLLLK